MFGDYHHSIFEIRRQSIKKPNLWNSEPASARSTRLCSGDFKLHSDTSSIMPCQLVIELCALEWVCVRACVCVCVVLSAIFCKLINEGSWGATRLRQILFPIGKNFYGGFSDVATGLWRGLFWVVRNVMSGTSDSNRAELPSQTTPNLDGLPRQWTTITLRKCLLWFVKIIA